MRFFASGKRANGFLLWEKYKKYLSHFIVPPKIRDLTISVAERYLLPYINHSRTYLEIGLKRRRIRIAAPRRRGRDYKVTSSTKRGGR